MNNKTNIYDNDIHIENKWDNDFSLIISDMKKIQIQINTIKEKVEELKKDRLFIKKRCKL
jgi:archaellum component FlaC